MFWPLALWLSGRGDCEARDRAASAPCCTNGSADRPARRALAVVLLLGPHWACMTHLRAPDLWGSVDDQALCMWALKNPASPRAQANAAQNELARGQPEAAITRLEHALASNPDEIQLSLNMVGARCQTHSLARADLERAATALRTSPNTGRLGYDWFERAFGMVEARSCPGSWIWRRSIDLLAAAGKNVLTEKIPGRVQDRLHLEGRIELMRGNAERARLLLFNEALAAGSQGRMQHSSRRQFSRRRAIRNSRRGILITCLSAGLATADGPRLVYAVGPRLAAVEARLLDRRNRAHAKVACGGYRRACRQCRRSRRGFAVQGSEQRDEFPAPRSSRRSRRIPTWILIGISAAQLSVAYFRGLSGAAIRSTIFPTSSTTPPCMFRRCPGATGGRQYSHRQQANYSVHWPCSRLRSTISFQGWTHFPIKGHEPGDPPQAERRPGLRWLASSILGAWMPASVRAQASPARIETAALALTALWAIAPINLTPVLLAVQRMESLAQVFVFAGLAFYIKGRERRLDGRHGWGYIFFGIVACTVVGLLAKETAAGQFPCMPSIVEWLLFGLPHQGQQGR